MEEKAKEFAGQEQQQQQEECEKTKQFILGQTQDNFQRCINAAGTEEDKEICPNNTDRIKNSITTTANNCQ